MSSPENLGQDALVNVATMQGILLTGEGLASMTPERLAMFGEMAGGLGLQLTVVHDLEHLPVAAEVEPEPVPATQDELITFALANGYTKQLAGKAWRALPGANKEYPEKYPLIRFLDPAPHAYRRVDLRSVYERLRATGIQDRLTTRFPGWPTFVGVKTQTLLARFVNEHVQPDEPIDIGE